MRGLGGRAWRQERSALEIASPSGFLTVLRVVSGVVWAEYILKWARDKDGRNLGTNHCLWHVVEASVPSGVTVCGLLVWCRCHCTTSQKGMRSQGDVNWGRWSWRPSEVVDTRVGSSWL